MDLERSPKNLSEIGGLIKTPITRRTLLGSTFLAALTQGAIGRAFGVTNPVFTQILGRPTTNSV